MTRDISQRQEWSDRGLALNARTQALRGQLKEWVRHNDLVDGVRRRREAHLAEILTRVKVLREDHGALKEHPVSHQEKYTPGDHVTVTDAAHLTGLSRAKLYQIMAAWQDNADDVKQLTNTTLAEYRTNDKGNERYETELHLRFPHLHGWWNAMRWLARTNRQAGIPRTEDTSYQRLRAEYWASVGRIAVGQVQQAEQRALLSYNLDTSQHDEHH